MSDSFQAVLFDWRGTLVTTSTLDEWIREALRRLGRPAGDGEVDELAALLEGADDALDGPGVDCDADLHRRTYRTAFRDLGIDDDLAEALYEVESAAANNPFADDAADTLNRLRAGGLRLAVVSDIHFDLRPAFAAVGLAGLIDVFTLSFEQGVQKPDPLMFTRTLDGLGVGPEAGLMVGDPSRPDGGAVEVGLTTLLLPPLMSTADRRLHHVTTLCGMS